MPEIGLKALNLPPLFAHCISQDHSSTFDSLIEASALSSPLRLPDIYPYSILPCHRPVLPNSKTSCVATWVHYIRAPLRSPSGTGRGFRSWLAQTLSCVAYFMRGQVQSLHDLFTNGTIIRDFSTASLRSILLSSIISTKSLLMRSYFLSSYALFFPIWTCRRQSIENASMVRGNKNDGHCINIKI